MPDTTKNTKELNMKKIYESPFAVEVKIEAEQMLAGSSIGVGGDGPKDPGSALTTGSRGEWGNLWAK